jgi:hypothetical protein
MKKGKRGGGPYCGLLQPREIVGRAIGGVPCLCYKVWIHIYLDFSFLIWLLQKSPTDSVPIDCVLEGADSGVDTSAA